MEADEFKSENLCEYKGKTKDILIIFDREKYDDFRLGLLRKVISDAKFKRQIMRQSFLAVAASGSVTLELIKYKIPT